MENKLTTELINLSLSFRNAQELCNQAKETLRKLKEENNHDKDYYKLEFDRIISRWAP